MVCELFLNKAIILKNRAVIKKQNGKVNDMKKLTFRTDDSYL